MWADVAPRGTFTVGGGFFALLLYFWVDYGIEYNCPAGGDLWRKTPFSRF